MATHTNAKQPREKTTPPITAPDRKKYESELHKISELIKEKEKQIGVINVDGRNHGDELIQLGTDVEALEEKRRNTVQEIKNIEETLRQLGNEIYKYKAEANRLLTGLKYMTEDKYDDQTKKLDSELQSGRYAFKDERTLRNEIENLRKAKAKVGDYQAARRSVDHTRNEQDRLRKQKDSLHRGLKGIRENIFNRKDKMKLCRQDLDRFREHQREKKSQQELISKEIHDLLAQRRELNDEFRQHQMLYMEAMKEAPSSSVETTDHGGHISTKGQENHKVHREPKLKSRSMDPSLDHTHEEERSMCRTLISYFSRLENGRGTGGGDAVLMVPPTSTTPGSISPDYSPVIDGRNPTSSASPDENYKVLPNKKDKEEEWLPTSSIKRRDSIRRDRKKSRKEKKAMTKSQLHLNPTIFAQLGRLGMRAPGSMVDVPNVLEELKQKLVFLESTRVHLLINHGTGSEAGDSGIMSSTGISEFSEYGPNDLTSGEVTPNPMNRSDVSPQPVDHPTTESEGSSSTCLDSTPMNSLKGLEQEDCERIMKMVESELQQESAEQHHPGSNSSSTDTTT